MIALFLGGWVTSRFTVGEDRLESVLNGAIVWGACFILLLWLASVGLGMGYSTMVAVSSPQGAVPDQRMVIAVSSETAAQAAWWAFAGTLFSMLASIGGALVGSEAAHHGVRTMGERGGRPIETTRTSPTG
jgi:hypothetical protein